MSNPAIVGFSGNITRPSKTHAFIALIVQDIATRHGLSSRTYDIDDVGPSLGTARWARDLDAKAQAILAEVIAADVLVVGSPTYKGSYTGLFKHFFDLIDPTALKGKPVLLTATGGGERHALIVEHQLRPLRLVRGLCAADGRLRDRQGLHRRRAAVRGDPQAGGAGCW
ncbi:hypothetical protein MesoLj113b_69870 (plasmid) [Mesorhizobium sp. 113-3-3]|nr:hypothetical protein MesoLj113b_69870 [Mesorhizobium sp. 113-3-3]